MTWAPKRAGKQLMEDAMEGVDKFWSSVNKSGECWEWQGSIDSNGYGRVMLNGLRKRAHRFALIFSSGVDHPNLSALHSCDNPVCCNPSHLRWGTHRENMEDRRDRKRGFFPNGEKHGASKLTDKEAARIKFGGEPASSLMKEFGVAKSVIYHIRQGRSWKHIGSQ